jgi:CRISPR-associated exonuclease Cas4
MAGKNVEAYIREGCITLELAIKEAANVLTKKILKNEIIIETSKRVIAQIPRIIYYLGVLVFTERITESMIEGGEFHSSEERKFQRRKTLAGEKREKIKASWSKFHVVSKRLGLYGTVNEVADVGVGLAVVENKFMKSPKKPYPGHVYQAVAYAMLAEEALHKPVRKVMVRYLHDGKSFEIPVTEDLRRHVLWTISKIRSIIEEEKIPREADQKKCRNCGYRKICKGI